MWAIRRCWTLGFDEIEVGYPDDFFVDALEEPCGEVAEIWIRTGCGFHERVTQVLPEPDRECSWAERILEIPLVGYTIHNVVIITSHDENEGGRECFSIYRPQRGSSVLNHAIAQVARHARGD